MAISVIVETTDNCSGCPQEIGCKGTACPNYPQKSARRAVVCDACGEECDELVRAPYQQEPAWICEKCLEGSLQWISAKEYIKHEQTI